MCSGWVVLSRKVNYGVYRVCFVFVGLVSLFVGDFVFSSIYSIGDFSYFDRVLYVLYMLVQIGVFDGDTGVFVDRFSQWFDLF